MSIAQPSWGVDLPLTTPLLLLDFPYRKTESPHSRQITSILKLNQLLNPCFPCCAGYWGQRDKQDKILKAHRLEGEFKEMLKITHTQLSLEPSSSLHPPPRCWRESTQTPIVSAMAPASANPSSRASVRRGQRRRLISLHLTPDSGILFGPRQEIKKDPQFWDWELRL